MAEAHRSMIVDSVHDKDMHLDLSDVSKQLERFRSRPRIHSSKSSTSSHSDSQCIEDFADSKYGSERSYRDSGFYDGTPALTMSPSTPANDGTATDTPQDVTIVEDYFSKGGFLARNALFSRQLQAQRPRYDNVPTIELSEPGVGENEKGSSQVTIDNVPLDISISSTRSSSICLTESEGVAVACTLHYSQAKLHEVSPSHTRNASRSSLSFEPAIVRPRSMSISQKSRRPLAVSAQRRLSLPAVLTDENGALACIQPSQPQREVIVSFGLEIPAFGHTDRQSPDIDDEAVAQASASPEGVSNTEDGPTSGDASSLDSQLSIWSRAKAAYVATYCPREAPPLILPTAPTDAEKVLYLNTNRVGLYTFGVFSFLSLSAGMWLFVISSSYFYWFGAVVMFLQVYLIISYSVSICGRDYDFNKHQKLLEDNPIVPSSAPTVDVYLPCCKEPLEVLENTYKHVQDLMWPEGKLKVHVLDDGASDQVKALATQYGFNYILREDRPRLKKAGNLRWAFARTDGDFFAIFDADFCPRPDFLHETMAMHLGLPDTAIIQTPQFFRVSGNQSWVEQGAGAIQELFYRVVQINRDRFGAAICVGSNAVYRRAALEEVGGTAEIGFSEDVHTGFYAVDRGWKVKYLPLCLACGICPDTPKAFFSQQMRWCMGSTTLLTNMDFWRSKLSPIQKVCYLSGMLYYSAISLSIFMSPLPGILMLWARPDYVRYYNLAFAVPSVLYALIAIRCWAKASYGFNVQFIMVIQSYAYLTAIKDRIFGRALAWAPSGDSKAHKNNKYRNMRILACCWMTVTMGFLTAGIIYQVLRGLAWYDCLPLIVLDLFNLFLAHRFLFWHGKI